MFLYSSIQQTTTLKKIEEKDKEKEVEELEEEDDEDEEEVKEEEEEKDEEEEEEEEEELENDDEDEEKEKELDEEQEEEEEEEEEEDHTHALTYGGMSEGGGCHMVRCLVQLGVHYPAQGHLCLAQEVNWHLSSYQSSLHTDWSMLD